jgi:RNA polymerase sigma-70 factor (ECF subfamily)
VQIDGQLFESYRALLFSIAYRMLGSAGEAEDVVQEVYLRIATADLEAIRAPRAFLATAITRLSLDRLKAARATREQYFGPWLPEPILYEPVGAGEGQVEQDETVAMALLLVMEQLSPLERAVFLLHDAFAFPFDEIGAMVGRSAAACRQACHRARKRVREGRPRFPVAPEQQQQLATRFLAAAREGDLAALISLLREDVVVIGDGGGVVPAATRPIRGAHAVARFFAGLAAHATARAPTSVRLALDWINGEPGLLVWEDGQLSLVIVFACAPGGIVAIHTVRNPAKLAYLAARVTPPFGAGL